MENVINSIDWNLVLSCLAVAGAKIAEISISSLKTTFMVKGERKWATMLAFIECLIWGFVISSVITSLSGNIWLLMSYCVGYSTGLFVGSIIESKIALGTSTINMTVAAESLPQLEEHFKNHNQGYSIFEGRGAHGPVYRVEVTLARKDVKGAIKKIKQICDNKIFIVSSDISRFDGGYGIKK
ncbi:MAG: hypothetical protein IJ419_08475 [Agathobacter sp.]|nr:hypothetical protein [Agathobacter sp.]